MEKINNLINSITEPFILIGDFIVRFGLGISFFLHGYGKLPISQGFIDFLASKGLPLANILAYLVAWGEILAGIGIILGGLLIKYKPTIANLITKPIRIVKKSINLSK